MGGKMKRISILNIFMFALIANFAYNCGGKGAAGGSSAGAGGSAGGCTLCTISGTISGTWISGDSVTLQIDGANNTVLTNPVSAFTFGPFVDKTTHKITILSNTIAGAGKCFIGNGDRGLAGANITDVLVTCGSVAGITGGAKQITVTWPVSRSFDVGTAPGGGHKVYFDKVGPGLVSKTTPYVIDVPNTTLPNPNTVVITGLSTPANTTFYVRIGAYSAINPTGGTLSAESPILVP
jgi:hypothetical protein